MLPVRTLQPQSRRGYTLVEVLIVVTVLGIAGAVAAPAFSQTGVLRVQASLRSIVADISEAQADALAMQQSRAVVFDAASTSYTIVRVPGTTVDAKVDGIFTTHLGGSRYGDAKFDKISFNGGSTLIFDEMGSPVAAAGSSTPANEGSLEVTGSNQRFKIAVQPYTGRVVVSKVETTNQQGGTAPISPGGQ
jgi:prepilin-type N-terminal cleavage/methylation domain-containing protein